MLPRHTHTARLLTDRARFVSLGSGAPPETSAAFYAEPNCLPADVDKLSPDVDSPTRNLDALSGNVGRLSFNVDAPSPDLGGLTGNVDALTGDVGGLTFDVEALI